MKLFTLPYKGGRPKSSGAIDSGEEKPNQTQRPEKEKGKEKEKVNIDIKMKTPRRDAKFGINFSESN